MNGAHCHFCKEPLNPNRDNVHQYTCGWVKIRSAGGGHAVALPQRENLWAHTHCIERVPISAQGGLFSNVEPPSPVLPPPTNARLDGAGRLIHDKCAVEGCDKDASFGTGVALLKGHLGTWYCREHSPQP
jgi:hypothetical protein